MRITTRSIMAAAALVLGTAPAFAEDPRAEAPAAVSPAKMADSRPNQRVCVKYEVTGSRIPRKTCETRAQWKRLGYDELAEAR